MKIQASLGIGEFIFFGCLIERGLLSSVVVLFLISFVAFTMLSLLAVLV
jgi:hypothetical protein